MTCPSCSAPVRPLATVCTACWTDLDTATEPEAAAEAVVAEVPEPLPGEVPAPVAGPAGGASGLAAATSARGWSTPVEAWYAPTAPGGRAGRPARSLLRRR